MNSLISIKPVQLVVTININNINYNLKRYELARVTMSSLTPNKKVSLYHHSYL